MDKKEFFEYLHQSLRDLTYDKKVEILNLMKKQWVNEFILMSNNHYMQCPRCGKYARIEQFDTYSQIIQKWDETYNDSTATEEQREEMHEELLSMGISINNFKEITYKRHGIVLIQIVYAKCPNCGGRSEKERKIIQILNNREKDIWDNIWEKGKIVRKGRHMKALCSKKSIS